MHTTRTIVIAALAAFTSQLALGAEGQGGLEGTPMVPITGADTRQLPMPADLIEAHPDVAAHRQAYYGDLHVHTTYSFDAFAFGTLATPYDAYRFAKGQTIDVPGGSKARLKRPLDFYAVTDHAMFLGGVRAAADPTTELSKQPYAEFMHNLNAPENMTTASVPTRVKVFSSFLGNTLKGIKDGSVDGKMVDRIMQSAWADEIKAAEQYNDPGKFTTFVAFEYTTSSDDRGNLHRNVIFRDADKLPIQPFTRFNDQNPEGLWAWMDHLRTLGIETLAIPHNSNGSNGQMFKLVDWAGNPMDDDYTQQRLRNEPLVEITQIKGTSETHPTLSPNDEWADFEIFPYRIATMLPSAPHGSYVREALLNGLGFDDRGITNPYKYGFVGASDTHVAADDNDESSYYGWAGLLDATPEQRGSVPLSADEAQREKAAGAANLKEVDGRSYRDNSQILSGTGGLTGVWADSNTRGAIYDAFRRKETFATSGPWLKVRFFGGYGFTPAMLSRRDLLKQAYGDGVPMGSDLLAEGKQAPTFIAWGVRDSLSAPLQRLQVIKGWTHGGEHHEMVYDVACASGAPDAASHRCPDNGAKVNLNDCSLFPGRRRGRAENGVDRSGFRSGRSCLLLRARARESDLPLVDLRRHSRRRAAAPGREADDPGTRLVIAHLVHPGAELRRGRGAVGPIAPIDGGLSVVGLASLAQRRGALGHVVAHEAEHLEP